MKISCTIRVGVGEGQDASQNSSHNMRVILYAGWFVLAIAAACAVLLAAGLVSSDRPDAGRGIAGFWRDLRAGWADVRARLSRRQRPRPVEDEVVPADASINDFFAAAEFSGPAYLGADEIAENLQHARQAVRREVDVVRREVRHPHATSPGHDGQEPGAAPAAPADRPAPRRAGHVPADR